MFITNRLRLLLLATALSIAATLAGNWLFEESLILFVLFGVVSACTGFSHGLFSRVRQVFAGQTLAKLICGFCAAINFADLLCLAIDLAKLSSLWAIIAVGAPLYGLTAWHARKRPRSAANT